MEISTVMLRLRRFHIAAADFFFFFLHTCATCILEIIIAAYEIDSLLQPVCLLHI